MKADRTFWLEVAAAGVVAGAGSLRLFGLLESNVLLLLAFPGMLASMLLFGDVHSFSPTWALVFAWLFWLLVFTVGRRVWVRLHAA